MEKVSQSTEKLFFLHIRLCIQTKLLIFLRLAARKIKRMNFIDTYVTLFDRLIVSWLVVLMDLQHRWHAQVLQLPIPQNTAISWLAQLSMPQPTRQLKACTQCLPDLLRVHGCNLLWRVEVTTAAGLKLLFSLDSLQVAHTTIGTRQDTKCMLIAFTIQGWWVVPAVLSFVPLELNNVNLWVRASQHSPLQ
jgi:hypothetical protein